MSIYMCSIKVIKRSEGKSIVAAAAYRAGDKIENEWDGVTHNYINKKWISHTEIILPPNAPPSYKDRSILWNAVEKSEKSSDARLGKEVLIALPREMNSTEQIKLVQDFVQNTFVNDGMCADIAIHNPPHKNDLGQPINFAGDILTNPEDFIFQNPHAHILLTIRPIDSNGKWEGKSSIEYLCKKGELEKAFTAEEFKIKKNVGWEKQYKYIYGKKKIWLTSSEGSSKNLQRVSKNPRTSKHGRTNETVKRWESPATLINWRKSWEEYANKHLKQNGYNARIDSRSYVDQGRTDEIPSIHKGPAVTNLVKKLERKIKSGQTNLDFPEIEQINNEIIDHNRLVKSLTYKIDVINQQIIMLEKEVANNIDKLEKQINQLKSEKTNLEAQLQTINGKLAELRNTILTVNNTIFKITEENKKSSNLINYSEEKIKTLGFFNHKQKNELTKIIETETKNINARNQYLNNIFSQNDIIYITDLNELISQQCELTEEERELNRKLTICIETINKSIKEYIKLTEQLAKVNISDLNKITFNIRKR